MRNLILKGYPREVDYITEPPHQFPVRIKAEEQSGTPSVDVVGALDGELQPFAHLDALAQLDDFAGRLTGRAIPGPLMTLGKLGTTHQLYIPWMQARLHHGRQQRGAGLPAGRCRHQRAQL